MEKPLSRRVILVGVFVVLGLLSIVDHHDNLLTGYLVAGEVNVSITSPSNGSIINSKHTVVMAVSTGQLDEAYLIWGSQNISMDESDGYIWTKTVSGYGQKNVNIEGIFNGSLVKSPSYAVTISYVNLSSISEQNGTEDHNFALNLLQFLESNQSTSELTYAVTASPSTIGSCVISSKKWLNCTPVGNKTGDLTATVNISDSYVSSKRNIVVDFKAVNDPPQVESTENITIRNVRNKTVILDDYFSDVDNSTLIYNVTSNHVSIAAVLDDNELTLSSASSFSSNASVRVWATDGINSTSVHLNILAVDNQAPRIKSNISEYHLLKNEIKGILLQSYFTDPDKDALNYTYNTLANIPITLSGTSLILNPDNNWEGTRSLTITASDGYESVSMTFNIIVGSNNSANSTPAVTAPAATAAVAVETKPEPGKVSLAKITILEDSTYVADLSSQIDISDLDEYNLQLTVNGFDHISSRFEGLSLVLKPEENWFGTDDAEIVVTDSKITKKYTLSVTVDNVNDAPSKAADLPTIFLSENKTSMTLDLSKYFSDPDGEDLEFEVDVPGVNVTMQSSKVVVFSLLDGTKAMNISGAVTVKDPHGKTFSENIIIATDAIASTGWFGGFLKLISYILIGGMVGLVVVKVVPRIDYKTYLKSLKSGKSREVDSAIAAARGGQEKKSNKPLLSSIRLPKIAILKPKQQDPEKEEVLKQLEDDDFTPPQKVVDASDEEDEDPKQKPSIIETIQSLFTDTVKSVKEQKQEPSKFRREALYLKEGISQLRALVSSSNDPLVKGALAKEREALSKAYHVMLGKEELSRNELRKIMLYVLETSSSLEHISDICEDNLIRYEIKKEVKRARMINNHLSTKLQSRYDDVHKLDEDGYISI